MSRTTLGIRDCVRVLLAILTDCGCPHIPSESFRLAKFDKTEAVEPFWRILHHVLCVHRLLLVSRDQGDLREVARECCSSGDVSLCVRKRALELDYCRSQFYGEEVGSRELLLFFAWLLQATSLVPQLQSYHVNAALHATTIPLATSKQFLLDHITTWTTSFDTELQALISVKGDALSLEDALRKVQWLKGILAGSCRSVENTQRAAARLSHSIVLSLSPGQQTHQSSSRCQLSVGDLFLLRYPEQLAGCVRRLEWHVAALEGLARWREHEPVFWQWMESVLDKHTTLLPTPPTQGGGDGSDAEEVLNIDKLEKEVHQCEQTLSRAIGEQLECLHKCRTSRESKSRAEKRLCISKQDTRHCVCLHHVAVETCVLGSPPTAGHRWAPGGGKDSVLQTRTVGAEVMRLQDRVQNEEQTLLSLKATVAQQF
jgi:hypothetical protein